MVTIEEIKQLIADVLQIRDQIERFDTDTELLGLPEFDSMAVVSVITSVEDNYGVSFEDEEISAEIFETLGSFFQAVKAKIEE